MPCIADSTVEKADIKGIFLGAGQQCITGYRSDRIVVAPGVILVDSGDPIGVS
jgi:hypothetical protein